MNKLLNELDAHIHWIHETFGYYGWKSELIFFFTVLLPVNLVVVTTIVYIPVLLLLILLGEI